MTPDHPVRRWLVPLAWIGSIAVAFGAGVWAGGVTLAPPSPIGESDTPVLFRVETGTVSRIQSFTAEAAWHADPAGRNAAVGTITSVDVASGQEIGPGEQLYSVDLRPVVAAAGEVPAFRALSRGSEGADVLQLQRLLLSLGLYDAQPSGLFDESTESAVEAWQQQLGVAPDGVVQHGDVVFLPELPVRVAPVNDLRAGELVVGGEVVIEVLPAAPVFTITLGPDQASLVPLAGPVILRADTSTWTGVIASSTRSATGEIVLTIAGADGQPVCGEECDVIPTGMPSLYRADLVAIPETIGPLAPAAALQTQPDGKVFVVDEAGREIEVKVIAATGGRAVVEGLEVGQVIRLFSDGPAARPPTLSPAP